MNSRQFKVTFFCVGVAKAGTTTLHDLLCLQNNISLPKRKETNYFSFGQAGAPQFTGPLDSTSVNETTITSLEEYINDFDYTDNDVIGEICPSYMLEGAAENLYKHNPQAKIIILLREPVGRALSNYQHLVRDGREQLDFEHALDAEAGRLDKGWEWFWGIKKNSMYFDAVNSYINIFGRNNVKIIFFEDFVKDQRSHVDSILEFIGLEGSSSEHESIKSNKSGVVSGKWRCIHRLVLSEGIVNSLLRRLIPPPLRKKLGAAFKRLTTVKSQLPAETRQNLLLEFSDDLTKLNELVGGNVGNWLKEKNVS